MNIHTTKNFMAEKVFLYVQGCLSDYPALRDNAKLHDMIQAQAHNLVMQITTWCMTGRIPTRIDYETVEWPDGVWQTFKSKFMPWWFVKKFPIRFASKKIEKNIHTYFVCPHLVTSPQGEHVKFMATGDPVARYFGNEQ